MPEGLTTSRRPGGLERGLRGMAAFGWRAPRTTILVAAVLSLASLASALTMRFRTEVTDLVPRSVSSSFETLDAVFEATESLFVLIESARAPDSVRLARAATLLRQHLGDDSLVRSVTFGWEDLAEQLLSEDMLSAAPLFARAPELAALSHLLTPEGIAERIRKQSASLGFPGVGEAEKWVARDPLELRQFVIERLAALKGSFRTLPGSLQMISDDASAILVRIQGRSKSSNIPDGRRLISATSAAFEMASRELGGGLTASFTGGYVYASESEATIRRDLTLNISWSVVLVLALFIFTLRRPGVLVAAMVPLAAGMLLGLGLFSIFRREMILLSLVSGGILAGLGIDFLIHLSLRIFSDPRGLSEDTVLDAAGATGPSQLFAAVTTAGAFLAFPLTGEKFLGDLGILSACGIVACMLCAQILFPAMLCLMPRRAGGPPPRDLGASLLARPCLAWPRTALGIAIAMAGVCAAYVTVLPPGLESDLRNLQAARSVAVRVQERIAGLFGGAAEPVLVLVEVVPQPGERAEDAAVEAAARLEPELGSLRERHLISAWISAAQILPRPEECRAVLEVLARKDAASIQAAFEKALEEEGFETDRFRGVATLLAKALARRAPLRFEDLRPLEAAGGLPRLAGSRDGKGYALVTVYPAVDMLETTAQTRLFDGLEGALRNAHVTGSLAGLHVISARNAEAVLVEFLRASGASCLVVAALVFALFRRLRWTLLALLPVTLGTLCMVALANLLGYRLNFMNAGILPMVVGIGVDDGIHMVKEFLDRPESGAAGVVRRSGSAVLLTSLTTILAFGTLGFSENQGIASVGVVAGLGVALCLLASLLVLPAALELSGLRTRRPGGLPCVPLSTARHE